MPIIKKTALLALLILPAFLLLHNYNELFGFIPISQLLLHALVIYSITATVYFLIIWRWKVSGAKTSLILFSIAVFMLFFTPIHDFFRVITFESSFSSYLVLIPIWCVLMVILVRKINKMTDTSTVIIFLNVLMICLLVTELGNLVVNSIKLKKDNNLIYPLKPLSDNYVPSKMPDSSKPDIYFFVFDEYTNNKILKKVWNFDNSEITNWLAGNDFYVPTNTRANYNFTLYSVSSTFNMNYLDPKKGADGTITRNVLQGNESISNNETFSILRKENYSIDFLAPFKNSIRENQLGHFFDFLGDHQIFMQTLPGRIAADMKWNFEYGKWSGIGEDGISKTLQVKYQTIRSTAEQIERSTDTTVNRKPHFVYGHFMIPHEPHLYDSSGHIMSQKTALHDVPFNTYTMQVSQANKIIEELVSYIRLHNKRNTIIIVEGDHGFRRFPAELMRENSLPNFYAIYFPDKNYTQLYNDMTPINSFRIVFNQYFNQHYPLLHDSSFVVKDKP